MNDGGQIPNDPPVPVQRIIDELCTEFEVCWRKDKDVRIEGFEFDLDSRWHHFALAELLLTEVDLRFGDGQNLDRKEYYDRFSDGKNLVDAAFDRIKVSGYIELSENMSVVTTRAFVPEDPVVDSTDSCALSVGCRRIPRHIGGFVIEEYIGKGSFGIVFRARDTANQQVVALKFPRHGRFATSAEMLRFLDEAKLAQALDHPGIVKTYKIGRDSGYLFIVQQLIDGVDLSSFARTKLSHQDAADLIANVADAVGFAHRNGLYHRDLKPSNILIDTEGNPWVIDFGLAIHESIQRRRKGERVGSPAYMSPELVRGETHVIDGRSDIWSLGIILYELLIGRRPFKGDFAEDISNQTHAEQKRQIALFEEIKYREAVPLRQFDPDMSLEMERICLRCLEKRISDRYLTATDLADDLRRWLNVPNQVAQPVEAEVEIAPQGLRSFGPDESAFFCRLLPGPRDRTGLPLSVRFWKTRIESFSPEVTFPIGFIYGPSGAGKSSFIRAGVLPRLSEHVIAIYVESTSQDTEVRLIKKLRGRFEGIPNDLSLPEIFDGLRAGLWVPSGKKLLLVFDQFEQWLHARKPALDEQLVQALRHCDGKHLQAICLVRDDFWLATTRFKDSLEVEMVDGHNAMLVDRFDKEHARKVLAEFGRAFKQLPTKVSETTNDQDRFLDKVIEDLAEQRRVISVRLSLFAEMFKNRPWTTMELENVGGVEGVGGKFLEETFSSKMATARHRLYREQVLAILDSLLPNPGVDIKGNLCSRSDLALAAGLDSKGPDFGQVLEILDGELKLITPTEPDVGITSSGNSFETETQGSKRYYQLTHDYLVPSVRDWVRTVQGRTRSGRAKLQLQELASGWHSAGRHHRFLPSFLEYCSILSAVQRKHWTGIERQFMGRANRFYGFCAVVTLLVVISFIAFGWKDRANQRFAKTRGIVNQFITCDPGSVSLVASFLRDDVANAEWLLRAKMLEPQTQKERMRTHVGLALLNDLDIDGVNFLVGAVSTCENDECINLVDALSTRRDEALKQIEKASASATDDTHWARLEILKLFLHPQQFSQANSQDVLNSPFAFRADPTRRSELIHRFKEWHGNLEATLQMLDSTTDAATVSGLCISLGRIERDRFSRETMSELQRRFEELFEHDKNASIHGASRWALTNWQEPLPTLTEPTKPFKGFDWWINRKGMTMVRVSAGIVPNQRRDSEAPDRVDRDFSIGACEVTVEQFEEFLNDPDYPADLKPKNWEFDESRVFSKQSAINQINQLDAILFCNWLSSKHGHKNSYRNSGQVILVRSASGDQKKVDEWELVENPEGYRLPGQHEWELAARAGCEGDYYFGRTFFIRIPEYLWSNINSLHDKKLVAHPVATRIPNQLGLFDTLGNVNEICWKFNFGQGDSRDFTSRRGGAYRNPIGGCQLGTLWPTNISIRHYESGFRVAINDRM